MTGYSEKRRHDRIHYETSRLMYKKDSKAPYSYAAMTNYSPGGLYLRTNEYMDIGQPIIVKMEEYDINATGPERYDYYYGQIRWIKNFHTKSYDPSYGYGIQFDTSMIF